MDMKPMIGEMIKILKDDLKDSTQPFYFEFIDNEWCFNNGKVYTGKDLYDCLFEAIKDLDKGE